jgi:hypothetical protein
MSDKADELYRQYEADKLLVDADLTLTQAAREQVMTRLRACANRQVAYVTRSCVKAIKSLRELPSAKSCQPIGAASYQTVSEDEFSEV